jgi:hypothetical protein
LVPEPRERSQTWLLEQSGWTGVLIEPEPDFAGELREKRKAKGFVVACSSRSKMPERNCRFTSQGRSPLSIARAWR